MRFDLPALLKRAALPVTSAVCAVFGYQFFVVSNSPPWMFLGGILLVAVIAGATFFIVRHVRRKKAQGPAVDMAVNNTKHDKEEALKALRSTWKTGIDFLRQSRLKSSGNPLYALPWYMVIGEPGSGKTTAIRNARLSPVADTGGIATLSQTKNCQWSFFEQAIIIDTAGRYATHKDQPHDKAEWGTLLNCLYKHRRNESLNGLIVTVPVDKLLKQTPEALETEGKNMRERINELMNTLGAKFPIYVQITKCDLLPGMTKFCQNLSETGLDQSMGIINHDLTANAASFTQNLFSTITGQLKKMRLVIANQVAAEGVDSETFLLPEQFSKLNKGINSYLQGAFHENPFQETPLLRGLFFSSGQGNRSPNDSGLFLHEFFSKILPADRSLIVPTQKALRWRREILNIKMMSWLGFMALFALLMSVSFVKNLSTLRDADHEFSHLAPLSADLADNINTFSRLYSSLEELEFRNNTPWYSMFGLNESHRVNRAIAEKLSVQFRSTVLAPVDQQYARGLAALRANSSNILFSQYIGHIVSRIRLIKSHLADFENRSLEKESRASFPFLKLAKGQATDDIKRKFENLYATTVVSTPDEAELKSELTRLQAQLRRALQLKGNSPEWVIAWANSQRSAYSVTLQDYWGGPEPLPSEPILPAIFSRTSKNLVESFFTEIENSLTDPKDVAELKTQFARWYHLNAADAWLRFAANFPQGAQRLDREEYWKPNLHKMAKNDGPYFALISDMCAELQPTYPPDSKGLPVWLKELYRLRDLQGPHDRSSFSTFSWRKFSNSENKVQSVDNAYADYRESLQRVSSESSDGKKAIQAAVQAFTEPADSKKSIFRESYNSLEGLNKSLAQEKAADPTVWKLIRGPLDFYWEYARRETAAQLQGEWETKVLSETSGYTGPQALSTLLGQEGPVMKFVKGQAGPFIQWKAGRGYSAAEMFNTTLPFTGSFFSFLNKGAKASVLSKIDNLTVNVQSITPKTNPTAKRIPNVIQLQLMCNGKAQTLLNKRHRLIENHFDTEAKSFNWTPSCGDVSLAIDIGGTHLVKTYSGPYGFFTFLGEFQNGRHTFYPREFPNDAAALKQLAVEYITIYFHIKGAPDLDAPSSIPTTIVQGWKE